MAQIAITALSLTDLSNTHWTARGLFCFSLVSSIIAVYYASSQHRVVGRCLNAGQVKLWIENDTESAMRLLGALFGNRKSGGIQLRKPAASSILTISAPVILLSASLNSFLGGFGVYLGTVWTKNLDEDASPADSRNVFLVYAVGVGVCYGLYALSRLVSQSHVADGFELNTLLRQVNGLPWDDGPGSHHQQAYGTRERFRMSSFTADEQSLVQALNKAATSREESVKADRRVADVYRNLSRQVQTNNRPTQRRIHHRHETTEGENSTHQQG